jgi:hypothetical protein
MMPSIRWMLGMAGLLLLLFASACSKEKLNEMADKAKQAVTEGADKVKEQAGLVTDSAKEQLALSGSCELMLDASITTNACYFQWLPQGSGRPNVLQVRSYKDPAQESFPSVMLHSQVPANGLSELVGQTIPAQLFVQAAQDQPIWSCPEGSPIEVKIAALNDTQLNLEITGGSVRNSQTGGMQTVTGKLVGVPQ